MRLSQHGLQAQLARSGLLALLVVAAASALQAGPSEKADTAPIRVTDTFMCPGEISPLQYGQFMEYLCDLVPSMWAEKLYDGSFEGLSPYKFVYLKETDFKEKPWHPC